MSSLRSRTLLVALLVTIIAIRASALDPVADSLVALAGDPRGAWREALDGWTDSGTLGLATAEGLRQLPFSGYYALIEAIGLEWATAQLVLRALLMVLALVGAVKVALRADARARGAHGLGEEPPTWVPWIGALLYAGGPLLSAATSANPHDAVALAVLPWAVAPLVVVTPVRWWSIVCGACWMGLAGLADPGLALTALVTGLLIAALSPGLAARHRLLWPVAAAAASAWWLAAWAWERVHAPLPTDLAASFVGEAAEVLGASTLSAAWLLLVATAPLFAALGALAIQAPATPRALIVALLVASVLVLLAPDWTSTTRLTALFTLQALAGLLAWSPFWHSALRHPVLAERSLTRVAGSGGAVPLVALLVASTSIAAMVISFDRKQDPVTGYELWSGVSEWAEAEDPGRLLVLPASTSETEAAAVSRALGARAWIGRDPAPRDSVWATRAIDSVTDRLLLGRSGPGTLTALQRLGVSHVLLRSDLSLERDVAQPLAPARAALVRSGATVQDVITLDGSADDSDPAEQPPDEAELVDFGVRGDVPAVEIWRLPVSTGLLAHEGTPLAVAGDPEVAAELADARALSDRAVELVSPDSADLVSDTSRRRDIDLTQPVRPVGPVVRAQDPITSVPPGAVREPASQLVVQGVARIRASSSAAQVGSSIPGPGTGPISAIDQNIYTSWISAPGQGTGQWWHVEFEEDVDLSATSLTFTPVAGMPVVTQVEVTTDSGSVKLPVPAAGQLPLELPTQLSGSLRLEVTKVAGPQPANMQVALAEVLVPDIEVSTTRTVPAAEEARVWLISGLRGSQLSCVPAIGQLAEGGRASVVCDRRLPRIGEENGALSRRFDLAAPVMASGRLTVSALPTADALALAVELADPTVLATASSAAATDLAVQAQAAVDGDPDTAWRAAPDDAAATLSLSWERSAELRGVRLTTAQATTTAIPEQVRITTSGGLDQLADVVDGQVLFDPVRTSDLRIEVTRSSSSTTSRSSAGGVSQLPVAVSEVELVGGPTVSYDADTRRNLGCGSGPDVTLAGRTLQTSVTAAAVDLLATSPLPARLCGSVLLPEGESTLLVEPTLDWLTSQVVLAEPGSLTTADLPTGPVVPEAADSAELLLPATALWAVEPSSEVPFAEGNGVERTISTPIPARSGWALTAGKGQVESVTLDGWAQGWTASPDAQDLTLSYSPRSSLLEVAGIGCSLWVVALAVALLASLVGALRSRVTVGANRAD